MITRLGRTTALSAVVVLALAACSTPTEDPGTTTTPRETPPASETIDPNLAYDVEVPAGITLTAAGSDLEVGDAATVAWQPTTNKVGVITVKVTRLQEASLDDFSGFTLDERTKQSTPYYVSARVTNIGRTDLSGLAVPLYLVDGNNILVEASSFQSAFEPCPSTPFPKKFKPGTSTAVCLVYLAAEHGTLEGVSFRPTQQFDPITWTGQVIEPKSDRKRKKGTRQG